jgi:hypothetical protein
MRIHITGASGSGTTTLGAVLASQFSWRHLDADSYYWLPDPRPFTTKRPATERAALLSRDLGMDAGVVLSGSICGWGPEIEDAFDLVVFLYLPAETRVARLRQREIQRHGAADPAFLTWAAQYDEGPPEGRSLAKHEAWLAQRACPVLRLDQDEPVAERVARVQLALNPIRPTTRELPAMGAG